MFVSIGETIFESVVVVSGLVVVVPKRVVVVTFWAIMTVGIKSANKKIANNCDWPASDLLPIFLIFLTRLTFKKHILAMPTFLWDTTPDPINSCRYFVAVCLCKPVCFATEVKIRPSG